MIAQNAKKPKQLDKYTISKNLASFKNKLKGVFIVDNLIVKPVDVLGSSIMAAKDAEGSIWVGINSFCQGLDMNKKQRDWQVEKIKEDKTLSRGCRLLPAAIFDPSNEAYALRLDFIPIWLAKISITKKMQQDHPELADKLLEYQLKAKDILAAAFLPKQNSEPQTLQQQIQLIAKGTDELYQRVDNIQAEVESIKSDLPILPLEAENIVKAVKRRGVEVLGGKESPAYNDRGLRQKLYNDLYADLKHNFDVRTYKAIRRKDADKAAQIVKEYKPLLFLLEQIENANAQQRLELEGGAAK